MTSGEAGDLIGAGELTRAVDRLARSVDKLDGIVLEISRQQIATGIESRTLRRDIDDVRESLRWAWRTIAGGLVVATLGVLGTLGTWLVTGR